MVKIKTLSVDAVKIIIETLEEDLPIKGNAIDTGDKEENERIESEIKEKLTYNIWAWCTVKITVRFKGLEASEYLGGCSYENEADFKKGGYYDDMVNTCIADIQAQIKEIVESVIIE